MNINMKASMSYMTQEYEYEHVINRMLTFLSESEFQLVISSEKYMEN